TVTEPIDTVTEPIDTVTEPIDTVTEPIDTITAPEWLAEWRRMPEITIPDVDKATSIPEWLEGWLQIPGVTILEGKEPLPLQKLEKYPEPATSTVPPPAEPEPVSEELSAQPRCPHCGAVLTQEQLDFQKTGTKVLCYNCFNMI
ncbi:MAG: hypothetical protein HWN65_23945, partial [Candidatus Helarchaeota archaeon]|nr:hypothetical protein [Candidatus Helarchaeota archaeon]